MALMKVILVTAGKMNSKYVKKKKKMGYQLGGDLIGLVNHGNALNCMVLMEIE